ncbi:MAG: hypothetical protein QOJ00_2515 [Actinomycetota bacterium]
MEFSFVFLLLVFLIYGIAAFGIMLSTKNSLTHAASEGARSALSVSDLPSATANTRRLDQVKATITKDLSWMGANYDVSYVNAAIANCSSTDTTQCVTVTITYPWSSKPLIPAAPGLGLVSPNTMTATAVVRIS